MLHPASNTGITAMIDTHQLIAFTKLLEAKNMAYMLVGGAVLMTIDDCTRPTDDFDFIIARNDIEQVEELEKRK